MPRPHNEGQTLADDRQHRPGRSFFTRIGNACASVDVTTPFRYIGFGEHWTPEGHSVVADEVERFLLDGKFMEGKSTAKPPP